MRFAFKFLLAVLFGSPGASGRVVVELVARLIGAGGLLALVKFWLGLTLGFPFSTLGDTILDAYDLAVGYALSWLEPFFHDLLQIWFPSLSLSEHWRQATILTALYMSRSVANAATVDIRFRDVHGRDVHWEGDKLCAAWRALCGALLALTAGIGTGLISLPPQTNSHDWHENLATFAYSYLFVLIPVAAVTLYHVLSGLFQALFRRELEIIRRPHITTRLGILLGFSAAAVRRAASVLILPRHALDIAFYAPIVILIAIAAQIPNPGFAALFGFVLYLGRHFSVEGKEQAQPKSTSARTDWRDAYFSQGSAKIGTSILGAVAWAAVGFAADWLIGR